jgi:hypothetical protein
MFKVQSHQSFPSLRTIALVLVAGSAVAAASLFWFRNDPNVRGALPTGMVLPIAVDPLQITREKKNLNAQSWSDFSVIFLETSEPLPSGR